MYDIFWEIIMGVSIMGMLVCGAFLDSESFVVFLIGLILCSVTALISALVLGAVNFFDDWED